MHVWRYSPLSLITMTRMGFVAVLCAAAPAFVGAQAAPANDPMIFSVWQGDGQIVKVGTEAAGIIGTFGGMLFTVAGGTPTDLGTIACPGIFQIDLNQGTATGIGGCVFNANDGAQAYGTFQCEGLMTGDCTGKFQINGGSGRLSGVKGESGFVLRTRMREMAVQSNLVISQRAMGVATWPGLRILLPTASAAAKQAPAK